MRHKWQNDRCTACDMQRRRAVSEQVTLTSTTRMYRSTQVTQYMASSMDRWITPSRVPPCKKVQQ